MNKLKFISILLLFSLSAFSQNNISGTVYDSETKETIPGVAVYFPDLHLGRLSDSLGNFTFKDIRPKNLILQISYIGYETKILTLNTDSIASKLNIYLKKNTFVIEDIIVSGTKISPVHEIAIEIKTVKLENPNGKGKNLLEQLSEQAGVDVISKGGGVGKPVIRGLSNTNILFIDNSVKLENFQFSEDHPFIVDEFGVEQIEIIKGPASLLYGSEAVGGVIYAIREHPPHNDIFSGNYSIAYHDNTKGFTQSLGIGSSYKKVHFGTRITTKTHKDYTFGDKIQVPNSRYFYNSVKSVVGFSHKRGKTDIYYDFAKIKAGMAVAPAVAMVKDNERENKVWFQDLTNHVVSLKNNLFFNKAKFETNASFQSNSRKLQTSELMPQFMMVDMLLNTLSGEVKLSNNFKKSEIITGIQSNYKENKNFEAPAHVIPDAQVFDISAFGLYSGHFSEKLFFQTGIRYDIRNIKAQPEIKKGHEGETRKIDNNYNNVSFSSGMTYRLTDDLLLRLNLASAHRSPNIAELTQAGTHGEVYEQGNPNLKSQRNYEPDFSIHYHNKMFIFEFSTFYNYINDYIFLENTGTKMDNLLYYKYMQDDAKIFGFETGSKIMLFDFVKLNANYSYIEAYRGNGDYLPFIPQNKIFSGIEFFKEKIKNFYAPSLTINSTFAFAKNNIPVTETETPEYLIFNIILKTEFKLNESKLIFSAGVNNIFNTEYYSHLSTLKELGYYNQGRNIFASLKYNF